MASMLWQAEGDNQGDVSRETPGGMTDTVLVCRKGTNGVSTNGVTAFLSLFGSGTFWVLPLTYFYLRTLFRNNSLPWQRPHRCWTHLSATKYDLTEVHERKTGVCRLARPPRQRKGTRSKAWGSAKAGGKIRVDRRPGWAQVTGFQTGSGQTLFL